MLSWFADKCKNKIMWPIKAVVRFRESAQSDEEADSMGLWLDSHKVNLMEC